MTLGRKNLSAKFSAQRVKVNTKYQIIHKKLNHYINLEWSFSQKLESKGPGVKWQKWKIENGLLVNQYSGYPFHDKWANRLRDPTNSEDVPMSWTLDYNSRNILRCKSQQLVLI